MAGITLTQAESKLSTWLAAVDAIATGQSYSIAGRSLSRANLADAHAQVEYWDQKVKRLSKSGGGIPVKGVTPV
jgi:hypothetical protein|tara:strand:- start:13029 stop:13250 length:222 start_codon:yes stop_codon:yes gene_type:complete